ncbi:MAG TPA: FAD-dependent oxidoreductase [Acidimicrobiales bacterium]|nr:FAD-dependent oxidoreductase [Acidimicrobiales bacterium]
MRPPRSLWWETRGESDGERPALAGDLDVDVAIVGGGYTGLWTARELLERDPALRVAVLEKNVCGFGASGRNGGWASALFPISDAGVARRWGVEALTHQRHVLYDAVEGLGAAAAAEGIDAQIVRGGTVSLARTPAQAARLEAEVATSRDLGVAEADLAWLDADSARERVGATRVRGATYTPHCARLHPARLVRGLARAIERRGALVFEGTAVTKILSWPGRRPAVVTVGGVVTADFVVRATEGFTPTLPGERRTVVPLYSLLVATAPLGGRFWETAGLARRETFNDDRHLLIYGQRTADDRLAFGGRGSPYHVGSTVEPRFDRDDRVFARLETTLRDLFPALDAEFTHRWGGPLAMPRDRVPSADVDHATGLASAGGYSGDGVVLSWVAATALADLIVDPAADTAATRLPFVRRSSRRWPVEPWRWLGINAGLHLAGRADAAEDAGGSSRWTRWLERLLG